MGRALDGQVFCDLFSQTLPHQALWILQSGEKGFLKDVTFRSEGTKNLRISALLGLLSLVRLPIILC